MFCPGWSSTASPCHAHAERGQELLRHRVETVVAPDAIHPQRLFVGAEGTLGLVTEATLNLVPLPAQRAIAMAYFPSVFAAGEAVPGILALGPTAVEIIDSRFLAVVRKNDSRVVHVPPQTDTALLIEFEGRAGVDLQDKFAALTAHLAQTDMLQMVRARDAEETDAYGQSASRPSLWPSVYRVHGERCPSSKM